MALATGVTSRPFTTLGGVSASESKRNSSTNGITSGLGNGAGTFASTKNIWGSNAHSALFSPRNGTRDSSLSREYTSPPAQSTRQDDGDLLRGSGALAPSSADADWDRRLSAWSSQGTDNVSRQKLSSQATNGVQSQVISTGNGQISPTATRPPVVNLNGNLIGSVKRNGDAGQQSAYTSQPVPVYTKFGQLGSSDSSSYKGSDSAISPVSGPTSPLEPRTQWPLGSLNSTSNPISRDPSQTRSNHSIQPSSHTHADFARGVQSASSISPTSTRNPSVSSQRNGSVSYFPANSLDMMATQVGQLSLGLDTRNTNSRKPPSTFGSQSYSSGSGFPSQFSPTSPTGIQFGGQIDDIDVVSPRHPAGPGNYPSSQRSFVPSLANARLGDRLHSTPNSFTFNPGQPYHSGTTSEQSLNYTAGPKTPLDWQDASAGALSIPRRSPSTSEQQVLLDPRLQQIMSARAPYYNMYSVPNLIQFGSATPYLVPMPMAIPMPTPDVMALARDGSLAQGVQSTKLYEFKMAGKNSRRYELKDIFEHIAEFAGDQYGSRFIQTKLETANSDDKERVFREIEPNAIQLMTDVFGNYVIQKFFDYGHQDHKKTLASKMRGQVLHLSLQMYGCRVVQKALEHVLVDQQAELVGELATNVMKCVKDQNGNHVIQKAIERCPVETTGFIYSSFIGNVYTLSLHPYGCRVIQRCLERPDWFPEKRLILEELHEGMERGMIADQFGNYVVQHVVERGGPADERHALDLVLRDLEHFSKHKFASNVVEKCIENADDGWRREVVKVLVSQDQRRGESENALVDMIKDNFGNYVIQKLLDKLIAQDYMYFHQFLQPAMTHAKRTGCGKQVLSIEKKMHRFSTPQEPMNGLQLPTPTTTMPPTTLSTTPFASNYGSVANTPPPLTNDSQSVQSSGIPSINGDTVEGATNVSRKGSDLSSAGGVSQ